MNRRITIGSVLALTALLALAFALVVYGSRDALVDPHVAGISSGALMSDLGLYQAEDGIGYEDENGCHVNVLLPSSADLADYSGDSWVITNQEGTAGVKLEPEQEACATLEAKLRALHIG